MQYEKKIILLEKSSAKLSITIPKNEVKESYSGLLKKYSKELQLPGFRKGKVPISILEAKYGQVIKTDVMADLIDESLKQAIDELDEFEKPLYYSRPIMEDTPEIDIDNDFTFSVVYDVYPKVNVEKLDGFTIKLPEVIISEDDINEELKSLQERNSYGTDKSDDDVAENGDIVTVDYCELDEKNEVIAASEMKDFTFVLGSKENIFEIDTDIVGMKKGETKEITKTFDSNYEFSDIAGKTKKIRVLLTQLRSRILPELNDEFAQDINESYKTLDDLKNGIRKDIQHKASGKLKTLKEKIYTDQVCAANPFEIPESMIEADFEIYWNALGARFAENLSELIGSKDSMFKAYQTDLEASLRKRILIEAILRENEIKVSSEDIENEFKTIAAERGLTVEEVKKNLNVEQGSSLDAFIEDLKKDKLYEKLYNGCTIESSGKISFNEFWARKD